MDQFQESKLSMRLSGMGLSPRAEKSLRLDLKVETLEDLLRHSKHDFMMMPNTGKIITNEICAKIEELGFSVGQLMPGPEVVAVKSQPSPLITLSPIPSEITVPATMEDRLLMPVSSLHLSPAVKAAFEEQGTQFVVQLLARDPETMQRFTKVGPKMAVTVFETLQKQQGLTAGVLSSYFGDFVKIKPAPFESAVEKMRELVREHDIVKVIETADTTELETAWKKLAEKPASDPRLTAWLESLAPKRKGVTESAVHDVVTSPRFRQRLRALARREINTAIANNSGMG